jgi:hypothetical protein
VPTVPPRMGAHGEWCASGELRYVPYCEDMSATRADRNSEREVPLTGARLTEGVVRVGNTVRRPMGPHSPFVHRLLRHLEAVGFDGAPRVLGVDQRGREVLSFLDGWVPPNLDHFSDKTLTVAARLLRRFHDGTAGCELAAEHEVVCHNDPSPCNYVFAGARPVALIDFDHAAPGDRLRDVAYAGWLWTLSADDGPPVPEQARRLRLMAESYGLNDLGALFDAVLRRQDENLADTLVRTRSHDGSVTRYAHYAAAWQREQIAWLRDHAAEFRASLDS